MVSVGHPDLGQASSKFTVSKVMPTPVRLGLMTSCASSGSRTKVMATSRTFSPVSSSQRISTIRITEPCNQQMLASSVGCNVCNRGASDAQACVRATNRLAPHERFDDIQGLARHVESVHLAHNVVHFDEATPGSSATGFDPLHNQRAHLGVPHLLRVRVAMACQARGGRGEAAGKRTKRSSRLRSHQVKADAAAVLAVRLPRLNCDETSVNRVVKRGLKSAAGKDAAGPHE